jgi:hypothetical protein
MSEFAPGFVWLVNRSISRESENIKCATWQGAQKCVCGPKKCEVCRQFRNRGVEKTT